MLIDQAYTLEIMRKEKDSCLKEIIGKRKLVILLQKDVRDFLKEEKTSSS